MTYFHWLLLLVSESACLSASFLGTASIKAQPGPLMQFVPLLVFPANGLMVLMEFLNPIGSLSLRDPSCSIKGLVLKKSILEFVGSSSPSQVG